MANYDSTTTSDFELNVLIGKSEVSINPGDLSQIADKGLHFKLPDGQTVELGELKEFIGWVNETFKVSLPTEADASWPQGIQDVLNGVLTTKVSVSQLKIDQEGKDSDQKYPPMDLVLSVNAKAKTAIELFPGLKVVSVAVGVKRTHKKKELRAVPQQALPLKKKK